MSRVLIVDDEESICWAFREFLSDEGHEVEVASSAEEALERTSRWSPDAVVLDVRLPGMDGLTAMKALRERIGEAPIVLMTAFGSLNIAVGAMNGGAFDYLAKPFDLEDAAAVVRRALTAPGRRPKGPAPTVAEPGEGLIGASSAMQEVFKRIALVAASDVPVLITGESGTGKELVARAIHFHSRRRNGPYLPVCLPALSPGLVESELFGHRRGSFTGATQDRKGLFELGQAGTILLDEIADTPASLQVKLLRALEHREVTPVGETRTCPIDVRLIAATNQPLEEKIAAGEFREDLFFRLSVFRIAVPPLRERREDVPALAEHFLLLSGSNVEADVYFSEETMQELCSRPWPGNVRELRNAVEHASIVARGGVIRPEHLPPRTAFAPAAGLDDSLRQSISQWALRQTEDSDQGDLYQKLLEVVEPPLLQAALDRCSRQRVGASRLLGLHRATLRQKLQRYGIE